uniref:Uncharacterized protein n=1 Tax=Magallana gigas TaxID=29159 RepID=K1RFZ9_MAGGI
MKRPSTGETTPTSIAPETSTDMTTNATIVTSTEADATTEDAMSSSTTTELSNPTEAETTSEAKEYTLQQIFSFLETKIVAIVCDRNLL